MKILAFESTCDETAVAIVEDGRRVLTDQIFSQAQLRAVYGIVRFFYADLFNKILSIMDSRGIYKIKRDFPDIDRMLDNIPRRTRNIGNYRLIII